MAANKKWAILYCPKKGMYSRGVRWSRVERSLMDNGIDFDYVQSENANSVERLITMFIELLLLGATRPLTMLLTA